MEVLIVVSLILLNGVFAMSELAVVSARRLRLQQWVKQGDRRSAVALHLHNSPNVFLSTIQIGITLIGILSGAVGEALIADDLERWLRSIPLVTGYHEIIATVTVVVGITYLSLVVGELVPKRLAMLAPEKLARLVASPMYLLSRVTYPAVWLLGWSVEFILRLMRVRALEQPQVTEEEVHALIQEGARIGIFLKEEHDLLKNVIRLADRPIETLMTPRGEIAWLDAEDPVETLAQDIAADPHARYPVARGNLDRVEGVVHSKDLLGRLLSGGKPEIRAVMRPPLRVPVSISPLKLLDLFRSSPLHMALVVGLRGEIRGLITLHDILESIVGGLPTEDEPASPRLVQRDDGSWLMDGLTSVEELKDAVGLSALPDEQSAGYRTVGGFVLDRIGRVPAIGDHFDWGGWRFEVMDMDGRRVDQVLVARIDAAGGR